MSVCNHIVDGWGVKYLSVGVYIYSTCPLLLLSC